MSPTLVTRRLELRPFCPSDVTFLHTLWTDPGVRRYLWDDREISREEAAGVIAASLDSFARQGFGFWTIAEREGGRSIGFCGLRRFGEGNEVELLYGLTPDRWGAGLATEAAREVLRFAFDAAGLPRVFAGADAPNAASIRVMDRLGMRPDPAQPGLFLIQSAVL